MTSADKPSEGFETKQVPGYVPSAVPGGTVAEPGYSNNPGVDPALTPASEEDSDRKGGADEKSGADKPASKSGSTGGVSTRTGGTKSS